MDIMVEPRRLPGLDMERLDERAVDVWRAVDELDGVHGHHDGDVDFHDYELGGRGRHEYGVWDQGCAEFGDQYGGGGGERDTECGGGEGWWAGEEGRCAWGGAVGGFDAGYGYSLSVHAIGRVFLGLAHQYRIVSGRLQQSVSSISGGSLSQ